MKMGTRSLLYGAHCVIIHPIFVLAAWVKLYGLPTWRELIAIVIHDWGYWSSPNMDGPEGEQHPVWAANLLHRIGGGPHGWATRPKRQQAGALAWIRAGNECLYHSRFWAKKHGAEPSRLCWADKLGTAIMPTWSWVFLTTLTGEIKEYMRDRKYEIHLGIASQQDTPSQFFRRYKDIARSWAQDQSRKNM